jgi:hypothetical protein
MGLLVFGTPTLLLLKHSFSDVLSILLPPSLTISAMQLLHLETSNSDLMKRFSLFCLPPLALSLMLSFLLNNTLDLKIIIAHILLFSVIMRLSKTLSNKIKLIIERYSHGFLLIIGVIHGLFNMGGSLLLSYVGSQYKQKQEILRCIVTGYLLFGIIQIITLAFLGKLNINTTTPLYCGIAGLTYYLLGQPVCASLNNFLYNHLFTFFMFIYALLLYVA